MEISQVLLCIFTVVIALLLHLWRNHLQYWKNRNVPYETPHPIYGNTAGFGTTRCISDIIHSYYMKFRGRSPFVGFYNFLRPTVYVLDPQLAKNILIKDFTNFTDRDIFHNEKDDPLTAHLFALDGIKWKLLRQKLSPTFTSGKMKFMFPTIVQVGERFVTVLNEQLTQTSDVVEVKDLVSRFTTDVIGTCAFGIECNSLRDPNAEFRKMGRDAFTKQRYPNVIMLLIQSFPHAAMKLHMRVIHDDIHNFFMRIVRETVDMRERHNIQRNDFMSLLINLKNNKTTGDDQLGGLTIEEIAAQAFVFFVAGFETSSTAMSFALYEMAKNQQIQDRCRQNINAALAKHNNELTYECMKDMQYLNQVLYESLRRHTVIPTLTRKATADYIVPDHPNLVIKKGEQIIIPVIGFHLDPEFYPNPEKFDPDRFSPEVVGNRDSAHWLAFGDGPRNCIGERFGLMQARIGLALLIKNFKFEFCSKTQNPLVYDPKAFLLSAKGGIFLKVTNIK